MLERVSRAIADVVDGRLSLEQLREFVTRELAGSREGAAGIVTLLATPDATIPGPVRDLLRDVVASELAARGSTATEPDATRLRRTPVTMPAGSARPATAETHGATTGLGATTDGPDIPVVPGTILGGRYRLVRELGRGGMGVVFLAEGTLDDQQYAVKILNADFRQHPDAVRALREEARKSLALRHPNIVAVYPLERDGATYYLPMEYLDGKSLRDLLDEDFVRGMPLQQAWSIIRGVGDALSFAHDHGVIHSDLKPANIFVTTGGSARVLDFGIARAMRGSKARFDTGSLGALTETYATSEMLAGERPDFPDDVYGFACVVYELLTGNHPFGGHSAVQAQERGLTVPPGRGLSEAQNAALRRALAIRRADRTPTVEEFLRGLEDNGRRGTPARFPGLALRWVGIGVAAVATVAVAVLWLMNRSPSPRDSRTAREAQTAMRDTATVDAARSHGAVAGAAPRAAGSEFSDCPGCPVMVVVAPGTFRMSSSREEAGRATNEWPQRLVEFSRSFAVGKYPVTRAQFRSFLERTGRTPSAHCGDATPRRQAALNFTSPGFAQTDEHPAVCVSADDATAYADWINRQVGHNVYRLPTEAEWEYAARAGVRTAYLWGDTEDEACRYGNFSDRPHARTPAPGNGIACADGYAYTAPVGSFAGNGWGIHDAIGNVRQWTRSCPHANAGRIPEDSDAWLDCPAMEVAVRGAGFATPRGDGSLRIAARVAMARASDATTNELGFRLVRTF